MLRFTDPNLYVKGTCAVQFANTQTGEIEFWSNKVQSFNDTANASEDVIRAGLGNGIATVLTSDSERTIAAVCANFSLKAKAMKGGATLQYSGIVPVCVNVTATGASISVGTENGVPVANYGYTSPLCYVQQVGAPSSIGVDGVPYAITADGDVTGFTATAGVTYKVWYFVRQASAHEATFYSNIQPGVYHATFQLAVYRNESGSATNTGTRVGWLYCIYPRYKLTPGGSVVGDQTTADTTDIGGRALGLDSDVVSASCTDCEMDEVAYYIYVPDNASDGVSGVLVAVGGVVTVASRSTLQLQPYVIMADNSLARLPEGGGVSYAVSGINGTTVSDSGLITAGSTAGSGEITLTYTLDDNTFTDVCNLVVSA